MNLVTSSASRRRQSDFESVCSRKFKSPMAAAIVFAAAIGLLIVLVSYVGPKAAAAAAKVMEPRPELYQNPYGHIVAIAEPDGRIILQSDAPFAERRKQIGTSYELVYVSVDWKLKKPVKK